MIKTDNPTAIKLFLIFWLTGAFIATVTELSYYDYSGAEFAVVHVEKLRFSLTYPTKWRAIIRNRGLVINTAFNNDFAIHVSQESLVNPTSEQIIEVIKSRYSCEPKGTSTPATVDGYPAYVIFYSCEQSEVESIYILRQNDVLKIILALKSPLTNSVQHQEDFHKIVETIDIWD